MKPVTWENINTVFVDFSCRFLPEPRTSKPVRFQGPSQGLYCPLWRRSVRRVKKWFWRTETWYTCYARPHALRLTPKEK